MISLQTVNRLKFTERRPDGTDREFKSHEMGMQVSCSMDHVVWIPKCRRKVIFGDLRKYLGDVLKKLAQQKECEVHDGHLMKDHVHMLISIPPKYSVSQVVGYMKGKSAIHIVRNYMGQKQNFTGYHFWARGYYVSTVGKDEDVVREYIRKQEREDERLEQLLIID